jgi:hypothetical protein
MKNFKVLALFLFLLLGSASLANVSQQANQNEFTQNVFEQAIVVNNKVEQQMTDKTQILFDKYLNNFRECEPLHLSQYLDLFGLKLGFKIDINGWVADKCEYFFSAKLEGLGKDIRDVYDVKVSDSQISQIEPKIKCGFSKEQLNAMVDYMLAESQKTEANTIKVSKKEGLTPEQRNLIALFMDKNACTVLNLDTLQSQLIELMQSSNL